MTMLDPTRMADWQIAEAAEATMRTPGELGEAMGLLPEEIIPYGPPGKSVRPTEPAKSVSPVRTNPSSGK